MRKQLIIAVALAGSLTRASAANADVITTGGSAGTVSLTKLTTGGISFSTAGFTTTPATFQSTNGTDILTGTSTFGPMSGTTGLETADGVFLIVTAGTETFSFNGGGGGALTGTITWHGIKDSASIPEFDDDTVLTVTTVSGTNAAFLADFKPGSTATIDFTVALPFGTTLANLATASSATATFASGEVFPLSSVPEPASLTVLEPASLTVLGSALGGLGWLGRRRRKPA
jgi:hypothetical protein